MKLSESRLDPSLLTRKQLDEMSDLMFGQERPALVGREGVRIELPDAVFHHLVRIIRNMREGKAVILLPENEIFTTQAAADFLGVSRPFFVSLIERGEIPHHRVGAHRRVYLKDLIAFMNERDRKRKETLDEVMKEIDKAGLYSSEELPDPR